MTWEGAEENYNVFRWYRAGWGRYTQADPIGVGGHGHWEDGVFSLWATSPASRRTRRTSYLAARIASEVNGFQYAGANPALFTDGDGLDVFIPPPNSAGEPILCTVHRVGVKPFLKTCFYLGHCTGVITHKTYLAAGGVLVPTCTECSPICTYESTAGTIAAPHEWECNPPMNITKPGWLN